MFASSEQLIGGLRDGNATACEELYSFIRDRIVPGLPLAPGVNSEEIVTDTASTVWLSLKSLRDDSKFFAFVSTIARRIASRRRRESARFMKLPDEVDLPPKEPVAPENVEREELLGVLVGALRNGDQQLFRLLYVLGAHSGEVQEALKVSPQILRKRKHRLHLRLRHAVGSEPPGSERA
jgi:DNA-directed RNA polymerase specialized sigma24 family protein